MKAITLVFPHQLFKDHPAIKSETEVYIMEEWLFFRQYQFHKQKLVLHRASMKTYENYLLQKKQPVIYIDSHNPLSDIRKLIPVLANEQVTRIHYADTTDNWLERRLKKAASLHDIELVKYRNPNFLNDPADVNDFFTGKKNYFQTDFYIAQRKQRNILLEDQGKPLGGKWSFDAENRQRLPKKTILPTIDFPVLNQFTKEAIDYVNQYFPNNYGSIDQFNYPVSFADAEKWLHDFLVNRFAQFGAYEDAIAAKEHFLYHSVLTPMLNIGLLMPQQVINESIDAVIEDDIPINSVEGFTRQVMGWREFIRIVYEREGSLQRTKNYWGFTRKIPTSFWKGETGIDPIDIVIKKILATGYSHHIERLMVMGNFMLLCEFDPDDVYRWFMEMYVDSYDWVMVPNVYGMTQFADGGLMTTKPYISGSNYLMKMGDFEKGPWQETWDGLFWRFMHVHRSFFLSNPRLGMLVSTFDKMPAAKQQLHLHNASTFLAALDEKNKKSSTNQ